MDELAALAQSVCHERFLFVWGCEGSVVEPLVDDASVVDLGSALGCGWEDELGVREGRFESSSVWELGIEKGRAEGVGIGAAAVKDDDGLFVREGGQDDEGFWVLGRRTFLGRFRGRHVSTVSREVVANLISLCWCITIVG